MFLMSVNGTALKEPSTYVIIKGDADSKFSYTSETGILVRDMIRANHVTIEVAWDKLSLSEFQALASLISNGQSSFTLTYFDYFTGADVTGKFYAYDRRGNAVKVNRRNDNGYECYQLSTQFIEF